MSATYTNSDGYNGYENRETWLVALHLSNDEGFQNQISDFLYEAAKHHVTSISETKLFDYLQDTIEEEIFGLDSHCGQGTLMSDLLWTMWNRINFSQIVAGYQEDLDWHIEQLREEGFFDEAVSHSTAEA